VIKVTTIYKYGYSLTFSTKSKKIFNFKYFNTSGINEFK
jgi:hypothetical protein